MLPRSAAWTHNTIRHPCMLRWGDTLTEDTKRDLTLEGTHIVTLGRILLILWVEGTHWLKTLKETWHLKGRTLSHWVGSLWVCELLTEDTRRDLDTWRDTPIEDTRRDLDTWRDVLTEDIMVYSQEPSLMPTHIMVYSQEPSLMPTH